MSIGSFLKNKVWKKVLDPLLPDEYVRGVGRLVRGDFGGAWSDAKTGFKDGARGFAVGMGGMGLAGMGPLAGLSGVAGVGKTVGGKVISGLGGGQSIPGIGGGGGGGIGGFLSKYGPMALGGINAIQNAHQTSRNEGYQQKALDQSEADYARRKGLEDQILGRLGSGYNVPDLGNVYADPSNPFASPAARNEVPNMGGGVPGVGMPINGPMGGGGAGAGFPMGPNVGGPMIQPPPPNQPPPMQPPMVPGVGGQINPQRMY